MRGELIICEILQFCAICDYICPTKKQSWEEVIKKPRREKSLKGLSEKQDQQAIKKLLVTNLPQRKKAKEFSRHTSLHRPMKACYLL